MTKIVGASFLCRRPCACQAEYVFHTVACLALLRLPHTIACRALLHLLQRACGKKGSTAGRWVGYLQAQQEIMHTMQSPTQVQPTSATPTATGRSLMTSPISDVLLFTTWFSWWDDSWWVYTQKKAEGLVRKTALQTIRQQRIPV